MDHLPGRSGDNDRLSVFDGAHRDPGLGAALGTQLGAAAAYTLVGLAFAEVPLFCHLAAPAQTRAAMSRVHDWVQARRRAVLGVIVAALGVFLMTTGMGHV